MQDLTITLGHYALLVGLARRRLVGCGIAHRRRRRRTRPAAQCRARRLRDGAVLRRCDRMPGLGIPDQRLPPRLRLLVFQLSRRRFRTRSARCGAARPAASCWWMLILTTMGAIMIRTNRNKNRALMPYATAVVGLTITFFMILLNFIEPPFATSAARIDGAGLNPQLKNYWMMIHPPCLYLGYVGFTIPFAFGIGAPGHPAHRRALVPHDATLDDFLLVPSWASASCSVPTGRTSSSAGAATGRGTR